MFLNREGLRYEALVIDLPYLGPLLSSGVFLDPNIPSASHFCANSVSPVPWETMSVVLSPSATTPAIPRSR